jgi:hypothetical protein
MLAQARAAGADQERDQDLAPFERGAAIMIDLLRQRPGVRARARAPPRPSSEPLSAAAAARPLPCVALRAMRSPAPCAAHASTHAPTSAGPHPHAPACACMRAPRSTRAAAPPHTHTNTPLPRPHPTGPADAHGARLGPPEGGRRPGLRHRVARPGQRRCARGRASRGLALRGPQQRRRRAARGRRLLRGGTRHMPGPGHRWAPAAAVVLGRGRLHARRPCRRPQGPRGRPAPLAPPHVTPASSGAHESCPATPAWLRPQSTTRASPPC